MYFLKNLFRIILLPCLLSLNSQAQEKVHIEWKGNKPSGEISVRYGVLRQIEITGGRGKAKDGHFRVTSPGRARITLEIDSARIQPGPEATLVSVKNGASSFSFFLRDVSEDFPIYIPAYAVVVLPATDRRSYEEVAEDITARNLLTKLEKIEAAPEESFESVEDKVLRPSVPTWLGISRDFRIFQITESVPGAPREANFIKPMYSVTPAQIPETKGTPINYMYMTGRGTGVAINVSRRLEEGILPILHTKRTDEDITYQNTAFVSLERSPLTGQSVKGTHYLVADKHSGGHMFTEEQQQALERQLEDAFDTSEETVLYFRSTVTNTGKAPRYAWFKTPEPGSGWSQGSSYTFDPSTGFSAYSRDRVFCVSRLNGRPLPNEEIAVLLQPGEVAVFEFYLPHLPLSRDRALDLSRVAFDERYTACKKFWKAKLDKAAQIRLPEKRIQEMIQAGLLHLDLITYGQEPHGTLAPNIGVYTPIGTESSPIIQFYNSMGWDSIARRALTYFLDKQHDDGFMQNFGGYMVETGAALWTMGEYFRYTNDLKWANQAASKLLKSCDYLLNWRAENKIDSLRGRGYGLIAGKVADPEDHFHQFMLNGYAYIGLSRVAEILEAIGSEEAERIRSEAEAWKKDIRTSFFNAMALSPVVPLGDGTWSPTAPPWTEATGPRALFFKRETFYSHGTFTVPDVLLGPLYLIFCEVLDPEEPASRMMLDYHRELFYKRNSVFSQPYYSRHNWVQAKLGMTKAFLKTYYNTFAALADRETYTFWEHLYHLTPHKTHEEAWFLMETRWMLYLEDGDILRLMNTIPRKWMEDGKSIELNNVHSYFGPLNVTVNSAVGEGYIEATVSCDPDRKPREVKIRLPHPHHKKPVKVTGGDYDADTETVTIRSFSGKASVRLEFSN